MFLLVFIGLLLKWIGVIDEIFCNKASRFVFNVAMPSLVFTKLAGADYSSAVNPAQIVYMYGALVAAFGLAYLVSLFFSTTGPDRGAFIHGSFRGNFAIMGLALINNAFGPDSLARAALVLSFLMPVYNVLGVLALSLPMHRENELNFTRVILNILKNPLIIAVFVSLFFSTFKINLPAAIDTTLGYLADLTLPLALVTIGGSLTFEGIRNDLSMSLPATLFKIVIMPLLFGGLAVLLGFRHLDLAVLYFLFAGPAAVASFPMAAAMGANEKLAAHIILITTLASVFTVSVGIYILRSFSFF